MRMRTVDGQYYSPSGLEGGIIGALDLNVPSSHPIIFTMKRRTYNRTARANQESTWKAMMTPTMAGLRSSIFAGRRVDVPN